MRIHKIRGGWEQHIGIKFPRMEFWGIGTIILMIGERLGNGFETPVILTGFLFIFTGIFKFYVIRRSRPRRSRKS